MTCLVLCVKELKLLHHHVCFLVSHGKQLVVIEFSLYSKVLTTQVKLNPSGRRSGSRNRNAVLEA